MAHIQVAVFAGLMLALTALTWRKVVAARGQ